MKINRFIHEHGTLTVKERKYFYFPVLIQNWISFPQIFLSSQTWRMYKKRTWWRRLQPHPGGMLLYPRGTGGGIDRYSCDPRLGVCTRRGHGDTYCSPTQVGCCFTHGGGGGGFAGISKEWPYTSILCFDQGAYHDFLSFFFGGGGRDGGQLHRETCEVNSLWGKQESFQRKLFETKIISVVS